MFLSQVTIQIFVGMLENILSISPKKN